MKRVLTLAVAASAMVLTVVAVAPPGRLLRDSTGTVHFDARPFPAQRVSLFPEAHAARNGSGTMSLYSPGNPVVSGTTITSSAFNNTMNDLATEMTDSLSRSGKGGMLAALRGVNGTVGAPAFSWTGDTDTGLYWIGANNPAMSAGGTKIQEWATTGASLYGTTALNTSTTGQSATVALYARNTDAYGIFSVPRLAAASFSPLVQANDSGLFFSGATIDTGGFVIGQWSATARGMRFSATGDVTFSGAVAATGALSSTGNFAVNSSKFTVEASSGNTVVAGTLNATGDITGQANINATGSFIGASSNSLAQVAGLQLQVGTTHAGIKTLSTGAGTVTLASGKTACVCSDVTAANAVKCSVSGTTLTIAGTGSDQVAYLCF
jgi:hypothetical protein